MGNGQHIGYIRVSTVEQNTARQLDGVTLDKVFEDKCSGKNMKRPALQDCLAYLRDGDTLHVHEISRLARNMADLLKIVDELTSRDVTIVFHKENMTFDGGKSSPTTKLMFQMLAAFSEFERAMIRERQAEGIAKAKAEGRYRGGQEKLSAEQVAEVRRLYGEGVSKAAIGRRFGLTRQSIYRYLSKED